MNRRSMLATLAAIPFVGVPFRKSKTPPVSPSLKKTSFGSSVSDFWMTLPSELPGVDCPIEWVRVHSLRGARVNNGVFQLPFVGYMRASVFANGPFKAYLAMYSEHGTDYRQVIRYKVDPIGRAWYALGLSDKEIENDSLYAAIAHELEFCRSEPEDHLNFYNTLMGLPERCWSTPLAFHPKSYGFIWFPKLWRSDPLIPSKGK